VSGHLDFLSPDLASADARWSSPLERALAHAPSGIDLSRTGVLDVRGELDGLDAGDAEVVRLTPESGSPASAGSWSTLPPAGPDCGYGARR
jgi:hypothetical protein